MKRLVVALVLAGAALALLRRSGPAFAGHAKQKCMDMMASRQGSGTAKPASTCGDAPCGGGAAQA